MMESAEGGERVRYLGGRGKASRTDREEKGGPVFVIVQEKGRKEKGSISLASSLTRNPGAGIRRREKEEEERKKRGETLFAFR